jgi:RNA polymerase sigma-70 factor (ECF subfamily)
MVSQGLSRQKPTEEEQAPLPDFSASDELAFRATVGTRSCSEVQIQEKLMGLFAELRIPLLRYLSAFPLTLQDSEDVIQEVFLALFKHWRDGKSHQNVKGWLFRAAHNQALKRRMRSLKDIETARSFASMEDRVADPAPDPEVQFVFNQTRRRLLAVVDALPEQSRWCLYLRAEGLRYREIAGVLGISLGSVSLYLERSLAIIARVARR